MLRSYPDTYFLCEKYDNVYRSFRGKLIGLFISILLLSNKMQFDQYKYKLIKAYIQILKSL